MTTYIRELKKIMTNDSPARPTTRSKEEIKADIAEISAWLKGPMANDERLHLVEVRRDLMKQLAVIVAEDGSQP